MTEMLENLHLMKTNKFTKMKNNVSAILYQFKELKKNEHVQKQI